MDNRTSSVGNSASVEIVPPPRKRGRPLVYSDASVLLIAVLARLWHLSSREVCL